MNATIRRLTLAAGLGAALVWSARPAAAQTPAPSVTVSGVVYTQYLYQLKDTANHQNEFDVTRAYVNVIGKFSGGLSTRVTADVFTSGTNLGYRLKYAYAWWTPEGSSIDFRLGLFTTPWIDWEEALWDYRMQGPIAVDRNKYMTSSDIGFGVDGSWNHDQVNMQVAVVNGEGYGNAGATTIGKRKDLEGRVSVRVMNTDDMSKVGGLRLSGYFGIGKVDPTGGDRNRFLGMVSYRSKMLTLAGEFGSMKDTLSPAGAGFGTNPTGTVVSGFGVLHLTNSPVAVIGRVDYVKPSNQIPSTTPGYANTRIIGGVSYQLTPNARLLADLDLLSYKNGSPSAAADATRQQALFQAQFTF